MRERSTISDKVNLFFANDNYSEARKALKKCLKKDPDNHWLITTLSVTYYEERKYKKALELSKKAVDICPNCPLSLWYYALDLEMNEQPQMAIKIWETLYSKDTYLLAFDDCGEGIAMAKALQVDCAFRLGVAYADLNNFEKAKEYFEKHLSLRCRGNRSIYSMKYVKERIRKKMATR